MNMLKIYLCNDKSPAVARIADRYYQCIDDDRQQTDDSTMTIARPFVRNGRLKINATVETKRCKLKNLYLFIDKFERN